MKLSQISENLMGASIAAGLGSSFFTKPALQAPAAATGAGPAEPEKGFVRTGGGPDPKKPRHRKFMRSRAPKPGV